MTNQRPFAVFDIDGTLLRWQLYHAVTDRLAKAGHIPASEYKKARDARMVWKKRSGDDSFRSYETTLIRAFESGLKSLSVNDFEDAARAAFAEHKDQVYTYTRDLICELKINGYLLFAISASQAELVGMMADYYGFDDFVATTYEKKQGHFTGKLDLIVHKKPALLAQLIDKHDATSEDSIGVGDSESDVGMLEMVERPIAFNPSKKLFQHADSAGWDIVVERKNMVYKLKVADGRYVLQV